MQSHGLGGGDGDDPRLRYVTSQATTSDIAIPTDVIQSMSRVVGFEAHHKQTTNTLELNHRGASQASSVSPAAVLSPFILNARHNLDWAINSFFLSQLRKEEELRQMFDDNIKNFSTLQQQQLRQHPDNDRSRGRSRDGDADDELVEEDDQSAFQRLPFDVVWRVFELLDEEDLRRVVIVSKFFRNVAESNRLWKRLFHSRFRALKFIEADAPFFASSQQMPCWLSKANDGGSSSSSTVVVPEALYESPPMGFWRELFREKKRRETLRRIRECNRCHCLGSLVPILYGFPSEFIVSQAKKQRAKLGGDHVVLIEKWCCLNCESTFASFPT
eukprot:TRINITY_DN5940_c0_g1_i2.p1 TRINITY_DN5940_c0_g1~~TRINITY_DN5940_c0_g1_i2.p1  ORF type:complete len:378 (-),score=109.60 TRINITY_DN5940_c0_g1_i2:35-1024(-)